MRRTICVGCFALLMAGSPIRAADGGYSIKTATTPVPKKLKPDIAVLLSDHSVRLLDSQGKALCELWFRKEVPMKAAPAQGAPAYRDLVETTILGAIRLDQRMTDFRQQKIKPGVYTLRLGFQPQDGDHMGTAPFPEFCLLVPAAMDTKAATMEPKALHELSAKASGTTHPAVFLLFPNEKPGDAPKLENKDGNKWILNAKEAVQGGGAKGTLGLGLTLIGHAEG